MMTRTHSFASELRISLERWPLRLPYELLFSVELPGKRNVVSVVLFVEPLHFRMKEVRMKTGITVFAAMLLLAFAQAVMADEGENVRPTLEKKLHGEWKGGPGVGDIIFRPDGTFERRNYSPGDHTLKGTWEIKWKSLPPTLVMKCKESTNPKFVDSALSVSLVRLNDDQFEYQSPGEKSSTRFDRRLRVRARVVRGVSDFVPLWSPVEPWISKVLKADYDLVVPKTDWITISAERTRLDSGNGYFLDGTVTEEKGEFKVKIEGCAGCRLGASATMKPGERTVVEVSGTECWFVALEVIEKK
jgi:hypothetical protein